MAGADYRACDKCRRKAFYDATLNYYVGQKGTWVTHDEAVREASSTENSGYRLDYLGDWAVLCRDCAKDYKTQIVPRAEMEKGNE